MTEVEHGPFTHRMSEDGCMLIIEEVRVDGIYTTTLDWSTPGEAEANVERALKMYVERKIGEQVNMVGQSQKAHRVGPLIVTVLAGPPTWWAPRMKVKLSSTEHRRVMIGWLRRGYVVAWSGWRKR